MMTIYFLGVIVSYMTCISRGYESWDRNDYVKWSNIFDKKLVGRLHNDDIHTYEQVVIKLSPTVLVIVE
jgi:hypothetical protein